jgi:hypothetical protein
VSSDQRPIAVSAAELGAGVGETTMRFVLAAIVTLSLVVALLDVHGSTDEQPAIKRAVKAPFLDLARRDARSLCADFTASVAASFDGKSCVANVADAFRRETRGEETVACEDSPRQSVSEVSWHGDHASAVLRCTESGASGRKLELLKVDGSWQIATPARLETRVSCRGVGGQEHCAELSWIRFGGS